MVTSTPPGNPRASRRRGSRRRGRGADGDEQIFVDASGRRKQWTRRAVLVLCLPLLAYIGLLATGVVSSSPLGTPPWIAEQPQTDDGDKPEGGTEADASARPSPSGKPGKSTKTPRPTGGAPVAHTSAAVSTPPSSATTAGSSAPGSGTTPPGAEPTSTKPGNAPSAPPGQTRRPTPANTNKGGH